MPTKYNFKNIRALLKEGFDDGELRDFCHDEPEFEPAFHNLAQTTGKADIVRLIVEYANKHLLVEILLAWAKQRNPNRFETHQPYYDTIAAGTVLSEDGWPIADIETLSPPLPEFDPFLLEQFNEPSGIVSLSDNFYIEREEDVLLRSQVIKGRSITTIRAPRQTGKSSLLVRGLHHGRQKGVKVVRLDFQKDLGEAELHALDPFLHSLAALIAYKSDLDSAKVTDAWVGTLTAQIKLERFMQKHLLSVSDGPLVLAIDEADRLLQTDFYSDFFGLLRGWYNMGADEDEWKKLSIVLVISTEPHLFIRDKHPSPFNIGLRLDLSDFDEAQVRDLNQRYGTPVQEDDLPKLMKLINGHPYLTRKALYTMVVRKLTWADLARLATADNSPFADHLSHQINLLSNNPDLKKILIGLTQ